jgi:beta-phosphoglucomutase-like phosphatase (HAD superfamily)
MRACGAEQLQVHPSECLVIEDSAIGLAAASGAGMRCLITYTSSTKSQQFDGAESIIQDLGKDEPKFTLQDMATGDIRLDDRWFFFPGA